MRDSAGPTFPSLSLSALSTNEAESPSPAIVSSVGIAAAKAGGNLLKANDASVIGATSEDDYLIREQDGRRGIDVMTWDVLGGGAKWPMTNVRNLGLPQWRRLAEKPENRCLVPLTEFCEWTPDLHQIGEGKPITGEMWFAVTDQPVFAVAGFWQQTAKGAGFTMVTCDPNELVAPVHPKAMITILHPDDQERWLRGSFDDLVARQRQYDPAAKTVRGPVFPTRITV